MLSIQQSILDRHVCPSASIDAAQIDVEVIVVTQSIKCSDHHVMPLSFSFCPNCPLCVRPPCRRRAEHLLIKVAHVITAPPDPVPRPGTGTGSVTSRKYGRHYYHDHEQLTRKV